jgi:hypothetical protein
MRVVASIFIVCRIKTQSTPPVSRATLRRHSREQPGRPYSYWMVNVAWPFATPAPTVPAWVCT